MLDEKMRRLESDLNATYKESQASSKQVLQLTQKLQAVELTNKELETRLEDANNVLQNNAENLMAKVANCCNGVGN